MTREISEYAKKSGDFTYHITSLKPLNPGNIPDVFEKDALSSFEKGEHEKSRLMEEYDRSVYRYMAPLHVEKVCMPCHAKQGYKIGDVRGGISVTFDVTKMERDMSVNQYVFIGLAVLGSSVLLGVILFLTLRAAGKLSDAYSTIEKMSITDELTDLYNRRYFHARLDEEIQRCHRYDHPMSLF
jgi:hypothetical protein